MRNALVTLVLLAISCISHADISKILVGSQVERFKKVEVKELNNGTFALYLTVNGINTMVFTDSEETYLFAGNILGANGENIGELYTAKEADFLVQQPAEMLRNRPSSGVWDLLQNLNFIYTGDAEPKAWVIYATECGYCQRFHNQYMNSEFREQLDQNVAWVPVNIGSNKQLIQMSADSIAAKRVMYSRDDEFVGVGKPIDVYTNTQRLGEKIEILTPTVVMRDEEGKVTIVPGMKLDDLIEGIL